MFGVKRILVSTRNGRRSRRGMDRESGIGKTVVLRSLLRFEPGKLVKVLRDFLRPNFGFH